MLLYPLFAVLLQLVCSGCKLAFFSIQHSLEGNAIPDVNLSI